jgi:hypothetical protein
LRNHGINIFGREEVQHHAFRTLALDDDRRSASLSSHCTGERILRTDRGLCESQRRFRTSGVQPSFVREPLDVISFQLHTPKTVGV